MKSLEGLDALREQASGWTLPMDTSVHEHRSEDSLRTCPTATRPKTGERLVRGSTCHGISVQSYANRPEAEFQRQLVELQLQDPGSTRDFEALRRLSLVSEFVFDGVTYPTQQAELEGIGRRHSWNVNYSAHGWHRYVGRFPPHLVRALLNYLRACPGERFLDPFAGSGTSLVEARLLGLEALGIEICPLSVEIAQAKTDFEQSPGRVSSLASEVADWLRKNSTEDSSNRLSLVPFPNQERWLTRQATLQLEAALGFLASVRDASLRRILLIALSSVMRSVGNVDVDVVRAEYRKVPREEVDLPRLLERRLQRIARDLAHIRQLLPNSSPSQTMLGDARRLPLATGSVDVVITSPPYGVETLSYLRTHLLSYRVLSPFLLVDPYSYGDLVLGSEYLLSTIAPEQPHQWTLPSETLQQTFTQLERRLRHLDGDNQKRLDQQKLYYADLYASLRELRRVLRAGRGRGAIVIGNKRLFGTTIPSNRIVKELLEALEFSVVDLTSSKLKCNNTNSQVPWSERQIREDFVLCFYH